MKHWRKRPLTCRQGPSENETLPEKPLTCAPKSTRWLRWHPVLHLLAPLGGPIFRRQGRCAGTAPPAPVAAAPAPVPPCSPPPRGWRRHRRHRLRRHRGSGSARNGLLSGRCSPSIVLLQVQRPAAAATHRGRCHGSTTLRRHRRFRPPHRRWRSRRRCLGGASGRNNPLSGPCRSAGVMLALPCPAAAATRRGRCHGCALHRRRRRDRPSPPRLAAPPPLPSRRQRPDPPPAWRLPLGRRDAATPAPCCSLHRPELLPRLPHPPSTPPRLPPPAVGAAGAATAAMAKETAARLCTDIPVGALRPRLLPR